ncbi:hypothetical protein Trydic_g4666 [Trypoxylus dichotomus]
MTRNQFGYPHFYALHLDEHRLLDHDQCGFRSDHSNTSQLFRITNHATTAFNRKQKNPSRTAAEANRYYLQNGKFHIAMNGSGVLQESALGLVLFTIYIRNIIKHVDHRAFNPIILRPRSHLRKHI